MRACRVTLFSAYVLLNCAVMPAMTHAAPAAKVKDIAEVCSTEKIVLDSGILGEDRTLLVRLPRGYAEGDDRYPVLFLLDAEWHFNLAAADVELLGECSYVSPHPIPRLIVVGIVNHDRNRDFTPTHCSEFRGMKFPTSGKDELFRRFLFDEVVPVIDATYRTHPYRILAGWSLGGLFVINTALSETPLFASFLAVSPSLWWDGEWTVQQLTTGGMGTGCTETQKLIVTLGDSETGSMVEQSTKKFIKLVDATPIPNLETELVAIEGLGHNYSPKMAFFLGLATNFADWNVPAEIVNRGLAAIDAYQASLTQTYGFPVPIPEDAYSTLGWSLFEEGMHEESKEVFLSWVSRCPGSPLAFASLGAFLKETGDGEDARQHLMKALELERMSPNPRQSFILDLQRDIDAISDGG